jgi:hypothetical protein
LAYSILEERAASVAIIDENHRAPAYADREKIAA